jgi:hypothetical protein
VGACSARTRTPFCLPSFATLFTAAFAATPTRGASSESACYVAHEQRGSDAGSGSEQAPERASTKGRLAAVLAP